MVCVLNNGCFPIHLMLANVKNRSFLLERWAVDSCSNKVNSVIGFQTTWPKGICNFHFGKIARNGDIFILKQRKTLVVIVIPQKLSHNKKGRKIFQLHTPKMVSFSQLRCSQKNVQPFLFCDGFSVADGTCSFFFNPSFILIDPVQEQEKYILRKSSTISILDCQNNKNKLFETP